MVTLATMGLGSLAAIYGFATIGMAWRAGNEWYRYGPREWVTALVTIALSGATTWALVYALDNLTPAGCPA